MILVLENKVLIASQQPTLHDPQTCVYCAVCCHMLCVLFVFIKRRKKRIIIQSGSDSWLWVMVIYRCHVAAVPPAGNTSHLHTVFRRHSGKPECCMSVTWPLAPSSVFVKCSPSLTRCLLKMPFGQLKKTCLRFLFQNVSFQKCHVVGVPSDGGVTEGVIKIVPPCWVQVQEFFIVNLLQLCARHTENWNAVSLSPSIIAIQLRAIGKIIIQ